ncbi:DUF4006 family protein [Sulfuricurvum sp.]|uniref:DUF4006 family protein n=1 Tax=Sulfuricurvum sp. TaxID=2025608 RepID=UPI00261BDDCC|nr:DUF4006 family protein [Sulfuricurvum sp.]MDD2265811.1 DUF4006 family protein [Sulfuricurvum sp.]
MENRSIFALDGITGMLIATVLLLSILAGLTVWGLGVQQGSANNFYQLQNEKEIKMISTENATHKIDVK